MGTENHDEKIFRESVDQFQIDPEKFEVWRREQAQALLAALSSGDRKQLEAYQHGLDARLARMEGPERIAFTGKLLRELILLQAQAFTAFAEAKLGKFERLNALLKGEPIDLVDYKKKP